MQRREITAAVIEQADRLLAQGVDHATVATRVGITEYVAGLLIRNASLPPRLECPRTSSRHVANAQAGLAATLSPPILSDGEEFLR